MASLSAPVRWGIIVYLRQISRPARRVSRPQSSVGRIRAKPLDRAHTELFEFEEFLDAVIRAFAVDAALFHATERRDLGRDDALVDADDAVFEPLGDTLDVLTSR